MHILEDKMAVAQEFSLDFGELPGRVAVGNPWQRLPHVGGPLATNGPRDHWFSQRTPPPCENSLSSRRAAWEFSEIHREFP